MKEIRRFFIFPIIIGFIGGFSAIFVRFIINITYGIVDKFNFFDKNEHFYLFFIPLVFIISSYIIHTFLTDTTNPTIDSVAKSITLKKGRLDYKKGISSVFLTAINIGSGVPVGREGPIAKFGGSFTSLFIDLFHIKGVNTPLYVTCGVVSALAATFNAPIAAIVFGFEIILGRLSFNTIIPLTISVVTSTIISRHFLGNYPTFYVHTLSYDEKFLLLVPIFALLFALLVVFYNALQKNIEKLYGVFKFTFAKKAFVGGLIVGILIYVFPDAASLGYDKVSSLFSLNYGYEDAFALAIIKTIALAITFASGMFGGIFAPSIFIGAFFGYSLGDLFLPYVSLDPLSIALIGTAAMTSGISSAPFRSSLIIIELTQNYQMAVPILMSSVLTYYFIHIFEDKIHFRRTVMQKGFDMDDISFREKLENFIITDMVETDIIKLKKEYLIKDIIYKLLSEKSSYFPIVEKRRLVGILSFRDIRLLSKSGSDKDLKVEELMTPNPRALKMDANGLDVFEFISHIDANYVPVIDNAESKKYVGMLNINRFKKYASYLYLQKR